MQEFELISRYFTPKKPYSPDVHLGIGDDAAIVYNQQDSHWVVSVDVSNEGIHFLSDTPAAAIGHKTIAVSLSDMAAMGAKPQQVLLTLSLPSCHEAWLEQFAHGFFQLADRYQLDLIGGDTCRGPLSITTVVKGCLKTHDALRRSYAKVGDNIYVTGQLGDASYALKQLMQQQAVSQPLLNRLYYPQPRVSVGCALLEQGLAHAAIDLSDGLLADLPHILTASEVGAVIETQHLPLSTALTATKLSRQDLLRYALIGGDDYELCFTAHPQQHSALMTLAKQLACPIQKIGHIVATPQLTVYADDGKVMDITAYQGYEHFT